LKIRIFTLDSFDQAHSAYHGIGIVKLMGRDSGFIAMHASLASGQIDICLIPEVCVLKTCQNTLSCHIHIYIHWCKFLLRFKGSFQHTWTSWSFELSQVPYRNKGICCSMCGRGSWTGHLRNCFCNLFVWRFLHSDTEFYTSSWCRTCFEKLMLPMLLAILYFETLVYISNKRSVIHSLFVYDDCNNLNRSCFFVFQMK